MSRRILRNKVAGDRSLQDRAEGSDTGPSVSNVLPVSVDSGGPGTDDARSGAAPLMATAENTVPSVSRQSGLRTVPFATSSAASSQCGQRMKWSKEMNISVMRAYYRSTRVEAESEGYRARMHVEWKKMYPNSTLDEQRICSQLNSIRRRNALSSAELELIKQQVSMEIWGNVAQQTEAQAEELEGDHSEGEPEVEVQQIAPGHDEDAFASNLRENYQKYSILYQGTPLDLRPRIPKITGNTKFYDACRVMNTILEDLTLTPNSLEELAGEVHSAALAVCMSMGRDIEKNNKMSATSSASKPDNVPLWKKRIQDKINKARRDIGHLTQYFAKKGDISKKVKTGIKSIVRRLKIKMKSKNLDQKLKEEEERLKQRIAALGARIRRYSEASKKRQQESMFAANQKKFYRQLEAGDGEELWGQPPSENDMVQFWSEIWAVPRQHNEQAYWLNNEIEACRYVNEMPTVKITEDDVRAVIKKSQNWKAPGLDGIHNVWWKYFTALHPHTARLFNDSLKYPSNFPKYLLMGKTFMLAKPGDSLQPKNYRPITCLSTLYKILTAVISSKINEHLVDQNLLPLEQNGCKKGTRGCKELLVIDSVVTQQVRKRLHDISVGWVDYKKAFDSVPHSWLLRILDIYKIDPAIINFLSVCMSEWKTSLHVRQGRYSYVTREIRIRRGMFQGDSLSPLWFCISLIPLSRMMRETGYGYCIKRNPDVRISHQFYMDDLKLYASNKDQLQSEMVIVQNFSKDICMEFGLDKCATLHVKRGKVQNQEGELQLSRDTIIQNLGNEDSYKYLGMLQLLEISDSNARNRIQKKVVARVNKICETNINSRHKISAINTWAIPVATYTFGVIKWTDTSLQAFDRKLRTTLTKHRLHHPHSSTQRLYLSRNDAGRGLLNLQKLCRQQEEKLRHYFLSMDTPIHNAISTRDKNISPLSLAEQNREFRHLTREDRIDIWKTRELHGRFRATLTSDEIDLRWSTEWLRTAGLYGETEGFLFSIQDQVIKTRAYQKYILGQQIDSKCRLCKSTNESIQHICSGCPYLAQTEYLQRHNNVARVVHQALAKKYHLVEQEQPYYKCKPEQVISNHQARILWDTTIITDRTVEANRPDIVLFDKTAKTAMIVDVAVPSDEKLISTLAEKKRKYQPLAVELKDMYRLRRVEIVPVVVSVNGVVTKNWQKAGEILQLQEKHLRTMQKAALLGTANIVRKFLSLN